ncbi:MAG: bifunctional sterol desaturase/short chain dehydrogenase [Synechococcales cyanobacterium RM1_1_8]|nr:bifunctional sterol desaturase/short chain dehydrogenase [Synechococcales cyanobacterium RM1_1_8]
MSTDLIGKTVAVTGASGRLGQALLRSLQAQGAEVIALSSSRSAVVIAAEDEPEPETGSGQKAPAQAVKTVLWQVGEEQALAPWLAQVDILVINHGVNVMGDRTPAAIHNSYEINAFSGWRLLELFLERVETQARTQAQNQDQTPSDRQTSTPEVWVNTSEAESNPAFSPLYELSKRTLGDLVTLRRLDAPCPIRKLILGPFKSDLNPVGVMSADWVAERIVALAVAGRRNVIVTINPLTFVTFPLKEFYVSSYFRLFTRSPNPSPTQSPTHNPASKPD